jgi:YcxB-like protein
MDDTRQIEIEFVYTKELFREAYRSMFNAKVKPRNFIWLGVILAILFAVNYFRNGFNLTDVWYYLPLFGIPMGFLLTRAYLPRKWGDKTYLQYAGKKIKWILSSHNVQIIKDGKTLTVEWSYFKKASISNGIILLVTTNDVITPIPVSSFNNNDFELFKEWLDKNVPG